MDLNKFHVVTCISNQVRYASRYRIYQEWAEEVRKSGVNLTTVELAFGGRPHVVTEKGNPNHIQLSSFEELWHKENMLNIGIQDIVRRHPDVEGIAWVDADTYPVVPMRDWFQETAEQLEHYMFVQMFEHAQWLDPNNNPLGGPGRGIIANYYQANFKPPQRGGGFGNYSQYSRSGLAWAARREALDLVGGLIDFAILGSADWYMAFALLHAMNESIPKGVSHDYRQELMQWEDRCRKFIKRDVGYMKGLVMHRWHGKIAERYYYERNNILIDNRFMPNVDLKRDTQNLWQLELNEERQLHIRDQVRMYFRQRNEDSIDIG